MLVTLLGSTDAYAQDGSVARESVTLHYRTVGTGRPLVLLSGGPGLEVEYMRRVAESVPASYQSVLLEQRGTGRSRVTLSQENMTVRHAVEDLEALRLHLKQERLLLVGHSWGGMLAMAYAAAHPERVDRMILISSGGPTTEFFSWFGDNIRTRLRAEDVELERYWTEAAKRGVDKQKAMYESLRAITPGYFFDRGKAMEYAAQTKSTDLNVEASELMFADLRKAYDLRPGLQKLDRPVLILHGHQDPIGDKTAEDIHRLIKGSVLKYFDKCGHFPWIEQPEEFRVAMEGFLKQ
jgi:proline iminopeptidase